MPYYLTPYLTPKQDDYNKIPELQVCIAEALYDAEVVLSNPAAFKAEEIRTLRDQITSNLERAWVSRYIPGRRPSSRAWDASRGPARIPTSVCVSSPRAVFAGSPF